MIRERFASFLARLSDVVLLGKNRSRIVLGTDRKDVADSGYGDGGEGDPDSASVDIVAGFVGDSGNPSFLEDKSRIYLSGKSNPDEYLEVSKGGKVEGESSILGMSDNIYLKSRNKVKIVGPKYSIILEGDTISIETDSKLEMKVGGNTVRVNSSGIELDAGQGVSAQVVGDNDICAGICPVTGSPILSNFKAPNAIVMNKKVVVK